MIFTPGTRTLYTAIVQAILTRYPEVEIREANTQIGFFHGCGFAWLSQPSKRKGWPEHYVMMSLGLRARLENPRITEAVEAYPGRWTHHILIASENEIDSELLNWIDSARAFALERALKRGKLKTNRR